MLTDPQLTILRDLARAGKAMARDWHWRGQSLRALQRRDLVDCLMIERTVRRYRSFREIEQAHQLFWLYEITDLGRARLAEADSASLLRRAPTAAMLLPAPGGAHGR